MRGCDSGRNREHETSGSDLMAMKPKSTPSFHDLRLQRCPSTTTLIPTPKQHWNENKLTSAPRLSFRNLDFSRSKIPRLDSGVPKTPKRDDTTGKELVWRSCPQLYEHGRNVLSTPVRWGKKREEIITPNSLPYGRHTAERAVVRRSGGIGTPGKLKRYVMTSIHTLL